MPAVHSAVSAGVVFIEDRLSPRLNEHQSFPPAGINAAAIHTLLFAFAVLNVSGVVYYCALSCILKQSLVRMRHQRHYDLRVVRGSQAGAETELARLARLWFVIRVAGILGARSKRLTGFKCRWQAFQKLSSFR